MTWLRQLAAQAPALDFKCPLLQRETEEIAIQRPIRNLSVGGGHMGIPLVLPGFPSPDGMGNMYTAQGACRAQHWECRLPSTFGHW